MVTGRLRNNVTSCRRWMEIVTVIERNVNAEWLDEGVGAIYRKSRRWKEIVKLIERI